MKLTENLWLCTISSGIIWPDILGSHSSCLQWQASSGQWIYLCLASPFSSFSNVEFQQHIRNLLLVPSSTDLPWALWNYCSLFKVQFLEFSCFSCMFWSAKFLISFICVLSPNHAINKYIKQDQSICESPLTFTPPFSTTYCCLTFSPLTSCLVRIFIILTTKLPSGKATWVAHLLRHKIHVCIQGMKNDCQRQQN